MNLDRLTPQTEEEHFWQEVKRIIREIRKERGLSVAKSARLAGFSSASWNRYENPNDFWVIPTPKNYIKMLAAIGANPETVETLARKRIATHAPAAAQV